MALMVQPSGELLMDSLYFSLRFSPDWQEDDSMPGAQILFMAVCILTISGI
jgi:hypothetical protein